jgi:hypothetical protein
MHICYIAGEGDGGYQVRVGRGGPGQTRFFAVRKHGGFRNALRAAERFAYEFAKQHPPRLNANNRSGVAGMHVEWRISPPTGNVYPYLAGYRCDARGTRRSFSYSIDRHGLEGAVRKALARPLGVMTPTPSVAEVLRRLRAAYPELGLR